MNLRSEKLSYLTMQFLHVDKDMFDRLCCEASHCINGGAIARCPFLLGRIRGCVCVKTRQSTRTCAWCTDIRILDLYFYHKLLMNDDKIRFFQNAYLTEKSVKAIDSEIFRGQAW